MLMTVTDDIDSIIKAVAKLENKAMTEMIRESRKAMRKEFKKNKPFLKSVTPVKTRKAKRSVKIKSKTNYSSAQQSSHGPRSNGRNAAT